jgi:hypothetical protein
VIVVATEGTVTTNQYRKPQKKYTVELAEASCGLRIAVTRDCGNA